MELRVGSPALTGCLDGVQEDWHEVINPRQWDARGVEGVANLSIERVVHGGGKVDRVCANASHNPCTARSVEAYRIPCLTCHGTKASRGFT